MEAPANTDKLWELIMEQRELLLSGVAFSRADIIQDERLTNLERDHSRMLATLEENGINVPVASSSDGDKYLGIQSIGDAGSKMGNKPGLVRGSSLKWRTGYRGNDGDDGEVNELIR